MHVLVATMFGFNEGFKFSHQDQTVSILSEIGYDVTAYAYRDEKNPRNKNAAEQKGKIKIRRFMPPKRNISLKLRKALKEDGPFDIIHFHHLRNQFSYEITRYALDNGIPIIFEPHGLLHDPYLVRNRDFPFSGPVLEDNLILTRHNLFKKFLTRGPLFRYFKNYCQHFILKKADVLIALSRHERDVLNRITGRLDTEIIPHWADKTIIEQVKDNPCKHDFSRPMILFVGQLKYRRGFDIAVKAFARTKKEFPEALLVIVTNNTDRKKELLSAACREKVVDAVVIKENISEEEKISLYMQADLYLSPTRYEGFGVTFLEAMACGCPVVSTDIPVVREVIEDGRTGLLARLDDPYDFYKKMKTLLLDRTLRDNIIENALKSVETEYNKKRIFNKLLNIYMRFTK